MPVYFFHLTEQDEVIPDEDGIEQPDLAAARSAAVAGTRALIAEAVEAGRHSFSGRFDVEDDHGKQAFTLAFSCSIELEVQPYSVAV